MHLAFAEYGVQHFPYTNSLNFLQVPSEVYGIDLITCFAFEETESQKD